eukprot:TRINITY_DN2124_c0_g1_i2.p1 TRINITY_DN2124_c0_g1~~TRINITY_DN2124_c0_g1_i2.p1  ORF type:complete len:828 (+),score=103.40 TRINITY_DN2124_c0_g1_i2:32-2515(+)
MDTDKDKIFDYVVRVSLESKETEDKKVRLNPVVTYKFPSTEEKDPFVDKIVQFCFPDAQRWTNPKTKLKAATFSFVLTESDGGKRWGYCARVRTKKNQYPDCYCILSFIPSFALFAQISKVLITLGSDASCTIFLNAIAEQPMPRPGSSMNIEMQSLTSAGKKDVYTLTRPADSSMFDYINFEPLLHNLDTLNILSIFSSLLLERRIIFVSTTLHTLSAVVEASVALLYPFRWQHIYIPVLPVSLLTFCCAPMPFVVGILRSSLAELERMSDAMEEVIMVDIDRNKFVSPFEGDVNLLPPAYATPLLRALTKASKTVKGRYTLSYKMKRRKQKFVGKKSSKDTITNTAVMDKNEAQNLSNAFIAFFVDLMASYRRFISHENDSHHFSVEEFIESQPSQAQEFLKLFSQSQMFEMFVRERGKQGIQSGQFESRVTAYLQSGAPAPVSARTRFTMYELGQISRDDVAKSVQELLKEEDALGEGVLKQGELLKLGGSNKNKWQTRWFVLRNDELSYYKNKDKKKPLGSVAAYDIQSIKLDPEGTPAIPKPNLLSITVSDRVFYLAATDAENSRDWKRELNRAQQNAPKPAEIKGRPKAHTNAIKMNPNLMPQVPGERVFPGKGKDPGKIRVTQPKHLASPKPKTRSAVFLRRDPKRHSLKIGRSFAKHRFHTPQAGTLRLPSVKNKQKKSSASTQIPAFNHSGSALQLPPPKKLRPPPPSQAAKNRYKQKQNGVSSPRAESPLAKSIVATKSPTTRKLPPTNQAQTQSPKPPKRTLEGSLSGIRGPLPATPVQIHSPKAPARAPRPASPCTKSPQRGELPSPPQKEPNVM